MKTLLISLLVLLSLVANGQLTPYQPGDTPRQAFNKFNNNDVYLLNLIENFEGGGVTYNGDPTIIQQDATHRFVTDIEKASWTAKADANHNHDLVYSLLGHDHDSDYAMINHNHNTSYALITHNHDFDYADINHTHAQYSLTSHNHDLIYQPLGDYAAAVHDHDLDYAAINHTHNQYSLTTHNHTGVYEPEGDYALSTHNHDATYQPIGNYSLTGHTHTKAEVGLANVDNTSDANKPVSTAQQTALNTKQETLVSGTNIKTINGTTLLGSGDIAISGGASNETYLVLAADVASPATTALTNLTGMTFTYEANAKYAIDFFMVMNSAASTTGFGFGVNCSTAPVLVSLVGTTNSSSTGAASAWSTFQNNAITVSTSGTVANAQNVGVHGGGVIVTGASTGSMQFIFRSETTAVTTAKANSVIRISKIN